MSKFKDFYDVAKHLSDVGGKKEMFALTMLDDMHMSICEHRKSIGADPLWSPPIEWLEETLKLIVERMETILEVDDGNI